MSAAQAILQSVLSKYSPQQIEKLLPYIQEAEKEEIAELIENSNCSDDALYWLQNWTATENPKYEEQRREYRAPFPKKNYFPFVFEAFRNCDRLFIPKTREMLTSWCVMGDSAHRAQWHKWFTVVQTDSEGKAFELIEYVSQLYRNQPDWLKSMHPLAAESKGEIKWASGGRVLAIPAGVNKIRLYHPTRYVMDEAAFLPEAEACYNAAHPVCNQIIAISSAGPGWFGDQCAR